MIVAERVLQYQALARGRIDRLEAGRGLHPIVRALKVARTCLDLTIAARALGVPLLDALAAVEVDLDRREARDRAALLDRLAAEAVLRRATEPASRPASGGPGPIVLSSPWAPNPFRIEVTR